MAYNRGNYDLSNVYKNRVTVNEIISTGLKIRSKYTLVNKDLSVASDIVGTIYLCQQGITTSATGSFTSTTVTVGTGLGLAAGMFINVRNAITESNNNVYEILTYISGTGVITIRTAGTQFFTKTAFTVESASGVAVDNVTLLITKVEAGVYSVATSSATTALTYNTISNAVTGPGSSTNNAIVTWNGTTGTIVKDNDITYASGILNFPLASNLILQRNSSQILRWNGSTLIIGNSVLPNITSASGNFGIGNGTFNALTSGSNNICLIALNGGQNLSTGSRNSFFGYNAGSAATTGSDDLYICNDGVAAESATTRIGTSAVQTRAFIAGISGITPSGTTSSVIIDTNGQLGTGVPSVSSGLWGELTYQGATLTTVTSIALNTGVFTEINIASVLSSSVSFDQPANGRLRYTDTVTRNFLCIYGYTSRLASSTNKVIACEIRKNGAAITNAGDQGLIASSTVFIGFDESKMVSLAQNDYVSLFVANITDGTDINVYRMKLQLIAL